MFTSSPKLVHKLDLRTSIGVYGVMTAMYSPSSLFNCIPSKFSKVARGDTHRYIHVSSRLTRGS